MHKAGSTIADKIFCKFISAKGMAIDRIAASVPSSPLSEREVFINYQNSIKKTGFYYGIARGTYVSELPVIKNLKTLVQVRDPRDCLTSAYFSFKISHRPPKNPDKLKQFMERRSELENLDIDQYVLRSMKGYEYRMQILSNIIQDHDDILVLKYEDMVLNTEKWLDDISKFLDQPITSKLRTQLADDIDFSVSSENINKHKRQVTPGDYLRKLKSQTIDKLNEGLRDPLNWFDYKII
ncbi:MAG: sulfotransferase domain-containing protein [Synechococcus sp. WH 8007]|nr:sulfotransferase domain-containing protein [Synechococcus sp. WH 8007]